MLPLIEIKLSKVCRSVPDVLQEGKEKIVVNSFAFHSDQLINAINEKCENLDKIFDKFLSDIHKRALLQARMPMLIKISKTAKNTLFKNTFLTLMNSHNPVRLL